jgi:probable HAF family extracellular repeat protein
VRPAYLSRILSAAFFLVVISVGHAEAAALYRVTDLSKLPGDASAPTIRTVTAINDRGQIVGSGFNPWPFDGNVHPAANPTANFVISGGKLTTLDQPQFYEAKASITDDGTVAVRNTIYQNGTSKTATGFDNDRDRVAAINNAGVIAGTSYSDFINSHVFIQDDAMRTEIDNGPVKSLAAVAINNGGQVLTTTPSGQSDTSAYLYTAGTLTSLGTLGGHMTLGNAINDSGIVVGGSATSAGQFHAFVWSNGKMTDLGTLGGDYSEARAVNRQGDIVGSSWVPYSVSDSSHAFLVHNGIMTDLNAAIDSKLGFELLTATGINSLGQVIGQARTSQGNFISYLLTPEGIVPPTTPVLSFSTPVPEPTTLAIFAIAGLFLIVRKVKTL